MKSVLFWCGGIVVVLGVVILAAWIIMKPNLQEKPNEVLAPPQVSSAPVAFISVETGDSVFVTFGTSSALFNGVGYSNILLVQVEAASGAKYESKEENLTLWNKETEVTVTRGRKIIFTGYSENQLQATSTSASTTPSIATSTAGIFGEWLWVETIKNGETIIPKKAGVFSITFSENKISGTTDCNGFSGTYQVDGDTVTVGALAMTKIFCEGSQEMEFTQQFIGVLTADRVGSVLTLTHSDGTISRFEAK
jgi:heat shock protein HslJ